MDGNLNLLDWYWEMPVVTRLYFTGSFVITVLCALDMGVSPLHLYYSWRMITMGEASVAAAAAAAAVVRLASV